MLVPEPNRVTDLMNDGSWAAVFVESDLLFPADHAYSRRTSCARPEANPVRLIRSFNQLNDGVLVPMPDRDGDVRIR